MSWSHRHSQALESIFIGSADIRVQLPEDSKRFDVVNADFQDLMRGSVDTTNVVEAANMEGRQERLEAGLGQLEACEKALQVGGLLRRCGSCGGSTDQTCGTHAI